MVLLFNIIDTCFYIKYVERHFFVIAKNNVVNFLNLFFGAKNELRVNIYENKFVLLSIVLVLGVEDNPCTPKNM